MALPQEQIDDAHKLQGDGIVYLYKIVPVSGSVIRLKADDGLNWNGAVWEGTAIQLDSSGQSTDGTLSRPKLTVANPLAAYSTLIAQGLLDNAMVVEYQVLRSHIDSDTIIYTQRTWIIRRPLQLNRTMVQFELRNLLDGQPFILPARAYIPPEFPSVSL